MQQVDNDFATMFRISSSELGKVFEQTRAARTEIQAIEGQMRSHANDRARQELFPEPVTMRRLAQQRNLAIQTNITRLRSLVSPATWAALSNFINTDLRNSISAVQRGEKKP